MCWKASAHYLQIWENTWVLYCSVLLLYSLQIQNPGIIKIDVVKNIKKSLTAVPA